MFAAAACLALCITMLRPSHTLPCVGRERLASHPVRARADPHPPAAATSGAGQADCLLASRASVMPVARFWRGDPAPHVVAACFARARQCHGRLRLCAAACVHAPAGATRARARMLRGCLVLPPVAGTVLHHVTRVHNNRVRRRPDRLLSRALALSSRSLSLSLSCPLALSHCLFCPLPLSPTASLSFLLPLPLHFPLSSLSALFLFRSLSFHSSSPLSSPFPSSLSRPLSLSAHLSLLPATSFPPLAATAPPSSSPSSSPSGACSTASTAASRAPASNRAAAQNKRRVGVVFDSIGTSARTLHDCASYVRVRKRNRFGRC